MESLANMVASGEVIMVINLEVVVVFGYTKKEQKKSDWVGLQRATEAQRRSGGGGILKY